MAQAVEIISEFNGKNFQGVTAQVHGTAARKLAARYGTRIPYAGFCFSASNFAAFMKAIG